MSKKIGILGCGPLPDPSVRYTTFAQLRTWSIYQHLKAQGFDCNLFLLSSNENVENNVHSPKTKNHFRRFVSSIDIIVTAGPFLPALLIEEIPKSVPLWLDWPSDPLADQHAKRLVSRTNTEEDASVQSIVMTALQRADAIGVISKRQSLATLGQLLFFGRENTPIYTIPIAYDFPTPKVSVSKQENNILITGSWNTWFDIEKLINTICSQTEYSIHCTGGHVSHYPEITKRLPLLQQRYPNRIQLHGWCDEPELLKIISQCSISTWLDQGEIEPLLGSRTRALFAIWNGLSCFASPQTELAQFLASQQILIPYTQNDDINAIIQQTKQLNPKQADTICQKYFSPAIIYQPLVQWLNNPKQQPTVRPDPLIVENKRLKGELQRIHHSLTWRIGSRIHLYLRKK